MSCIYAVLQQPIAQNFLKAISFYLFTLTSEIWTPNNIYNNNNNNKDLRNKTFDNMYVCQCQMLMILNS